MVLGLKYFVPHFSATETNENPMMSNRSMLKDFIATIATVSGDLSNITAPPFVLDPKSVVEIPTFWAENPSLFISPVTSSDPAERALLILKSFLAGMKSQCYMGHTEEEGVKKPLNAFLGEVFRGHWHEEHSGTTHLVSEQVSHHPPITACRVWNDDYGVVAEGFNRQKITFNGSVNIMMQGYALKSLTKLDEHYLLPLPDFKVKGVLSGAPYPETSGVYYIPSTSGYMSKIEFFGKSFFSSSGKRHEFEASVFRDEDGEDQPIYTIKGEWNKSFTLRDERTHEDIEVFEVNAQSKELAQLQLPPVEEMDPWESRRAWKDTIAGIQALDFGKTGKSKSRLEQGQRDMRKQEEAAGEEWKQLFFKKQNSIDIVSQLEAKLPNLKKSKKDPEDVWVFDMASWKENKGRPLHPEKPNPDNTREGDSARSSIDSGRSSEESWRKERGSTTSIDTMDLPRESVSEESAKADVGSAKPSTGGHPSQKTDGTTDERVGTVEDGRVPNADGLRIDVGRQPDRPEIEGLSQTQPEPQTAQKAVKEEVDGSGIEGLSLSEKKGVENMLRDAYASEPANKKQ